MAKISDIKQLFKEDQKDRRQITSEFFAMKRKPKNLIVRTLIANDTRRQKKLHKILSVVGNLTAEEYYMAALILHHGRGVADYKKALVMVRKAVKLGEERAKWLYAAIIDRLALQQKKKQRYGTQYAFRGGKWSLCPIDSSISDVQRAVYNVPVLSKTLTNLEKWNSNLKK